MIVIIMATISKVDTSPKDVTVIMTASTFVLLCRDLKYKNIELSNADVTCKATTDVNATKVIINANSWMDLISIIQVGHNIDRCNKWF